MLEKRLRRLASASKRHVIADRLSVDVIKASNVSLVAAIVIVGDTYRTSVYAGESWARTGEVRCGLKSSVTGRGVLGRDKPIATELDIGTVRNTGQLRRRHDEAWASGLHTFS